MSQPTGDVEIMLHLELQVFRYKLNGPILLLVAMTAA